MGHAQLYLKELLSGLNLGYLDPQIYHHTFNEQLWNHLRKEEGRVADPVKVDPYLDPTVKNNRIRPSKETTTKNQENLDFRRILDLVLQTKPGRDPNFLIQKNPDPILRKTDLIYSKFWIRNRNPGGRALSTNFRPYSLTLHLILSVSFYMSPICFR